MATVSIPLTHGQVAIIDEEDEALIAPHKWKATKRQSGGFYAARFEIGTDGKRHRIAMHRVIAGALDGEEVDHWDLDTLNNTRANLRRCTKTQNHRNRPAPRTNRTGYKGVFFRKGAITSPWEAHIGYPVEYLGVFPTAEEAAEAYNRAAIERYGEFARLNVIDYANPKQPPVPRQIALTIPRERREHATGSSGQRGIYPHPQSGRWRVRVYRDGKNVNLGYFDTVDEAIRARDKALQCPSQES